MKRYDAIYADPPWPEPARQNSRILQHFHSMSWLDINTLPVVSLAAPDSALFLWAKGGMLPRALTTIAAWGFKFVAMGFVWVKPTRRDPSKWHMGMGSWTRVNAEFCLIGRRGRCIRQGRGVQQIVCEPVGSLGTKPTAVRERIVQLVGDVPRIELFARGSVPAGWDAYGDQAENSIDMEQYR